MRTELSALPQPHQEETTSILDALPSYALKLLKADNPEKINWGGYRFMESTHKPVPSLPVDDLPGLHEVWEKLKSRMVPLQAEPHGKAQLGIMLMALASTQRYSPKITEQTAEVRDAIWVHALKEFPFFIIQKAMEEFCMARPEFPTPAEIREISLRLKWSEERIMTCIAALIGKITVNNNLITT